MTKHLKCQQCGGLWPQTGRAQKFCRSCAEDRARESKRASFKNRDKPDAHKILLRLISSIEQALALVEPAIGLREHIGRLCADARIDALDCGVVKELEGKERTKESNE